MPNKPMRVLSDIVGGVLDLVYPPYCLVCGRDGANYLCQECSDKICLIKPPYCLKCGVPSESRRCPDCHTREFAFLSAQAAATYDGVMRDAIHALKYDFHIVMADVLAEIVVRSFARTRLAEQIDVVIPVPIHRSRFLERGFNQSAELAARLCNRTNLVLDTDVLRAVKRTRHQVDLPEDLRAANVRDAFAVRSPDKIWRKNILLVDDVLTTGATASECARILLRAGAASVRVYTLARSL